MRPSIRWIQILCGRAMITLLVLGLEVAVAFAHGEAALTVTPQVAAPNSVITISAEEVEDGEIFIITLEATTFTVRLGTATVEGEGFREEFTIPSHVPPGVYQVTATTAKGEVISAELTVETGETATQQTAVVEPSGEPMELDRSKPTAQLVAIVAGIIISAGLGVLLVRAKEQTSGA